MKRGNEEFSDKKVTLFLIAAILISLISTLTVYTTLNEIKSTPQKSIPHPNQQSSTGLISLTILEKEEPINGTK